MNKEKIKDFLKAFFTYLSVIAIVGGIGYWVWKNPIYNPVGPQSQEVRSDIEVRFIDAVVKGRKDGTPHWTVYSKVVESERNSPMVYFRNKPNGEFYNLKDWTKQIDTDEKAPKTTVQNTFFAAPPAPGTSPTPSPNEQKYRAFTWNADQAEYNTETEDLVLKNHVDIITDDKDKIKTDELRWNNNSKKAISDKRTNITASKGYPIIDADHVEGDVKLDVLDLKGHVEINTELSEDQQL